MRKKQTKKPNKGYNPPYDESKLDEITRRLYRTYWELFDAYFEPKAVKNDK
jgi:hypothetical protein